MKVFVVTMFSDDPYEIDEPVAGVYKFKAKADKEAADLANESGYNCHVVELELDESVIPE